MTYTEKEENELNRELKRWQKKQLTLVKKNNCDEVFERMTEIDRRVWEIVANAKSYRDVNWLAWRMADDVISKYCKMGR